MEKMSLSDSRCERIGVDHLFEWLPNDTVRVRSFWFAKWNLAVTNDLDIKFASAKSEDGVCNGQLVCGDLREPIPSYRTYSSSAESDGLSSV